MNNRAKEVSEQKSWLVLPGKECTTIVYSSKVGFWRNRDNALLGHCDRTYPQRNSKLRLHEDAEKAYNMFVAGRQIDLPGWKKGRF